MVQYGITIDGELLLNGADGIRLFAKEDFADLFIENQGLRDELGYDRVKVVKLTIDSPELVT